MTWDCFADDGLGALGVYKLGVCKLYGALLGIRSLCCLEIFDAV
jgi:hypothetical protein